MNNVHVCVCSKRWELVHVRARPFSTLLSQQTPLPRSSGEWYVGVRRHLSNVLRTKTIRVELLQKYRITYKYEYNNQ